MPTGKCKQHIRDKIAHQYKIHDTTKDEPGVIFQGSIFKFIIFGDLRLKLSLDKIEKLWVRVLPSGRVDKDL